MISTCAFSGANPWLQLQIWWIPWPFTMNKRINSVWPSYIEHLAPFSWLLKTIDLSRCIHSCCLNKWKLVKYTNISNKGWGPLFGKQGKHSAQQVILRLNSPSAKQRQVLSTKQRGCRLHWTRKHPPTKQRLGQNENHEILQVMVQQTKTYIAWKLVLGKLEKGDQW